MVCVYETITVTDIVCSVVFHSRKHTLLIWKNVLFSAGLSIISLDEGNMYLMKRLRSLQYKQMVEFCTKVIHLLESLNIGFLIIMNAIMPSII